jgi:hypothetical protein
MSLERILILMTFVVVGLSGLYHFQNTRAPASNNKLTYTFSTDVGDAAVQLKRNRHADIYRQLDANAQGLLVSLVRENCSTKYDEQTCLHYAISCGRPCLAFLNKSERRRMLSSYKHIKGDL